MKTFAVLSLFASVALASVSHYRFLSFGWVYS